MAHPTAARPICSDKSANFRVWLRNSSRSLRDDASHRGRRPQTSVGSRQRSTPELPICGDRTSNFVTTFIACLRSWNINSNLRFESSPTADPAEQHEWQAAHDALKHAIG